MDFKKLITSSNDVYGIFVKRPEIKTRTKGDSYAEHYSVTQAKLNAVVRCRVLSFLSIF